MAITNEQLIKSAYSALENSYSPYSEFAVGAALLCENEKVYSGCNIENSSYPAGICAERTAFSKALSEGERRFIRIAVVCRKNRKCFPCGICRQFMSEFVDGDFEIVLNDGSDTSVIKMSELLPFAFDLKDNRE